MMMKMMMRIWKIDCDGGRWIDDDDLLIPDVIAF